MKDNINKNNENITDDADILSIPYVPGEKIKKIDISEQLQTETIFGTEVISPYYNFELLWKIFFLTNTTAGAIADKVSKVATSRGYFIEGKNQKNIDKINELLSNCYLMKKQVSVEEQKVIIEKSMTFQEMMRYVVLDLMFTGNGYIEALRNIKGDLVGFVYTPSTTIRVLKQLLGYLQEINGSKVFFNNYQPDKNKRRQFSLHRKKGIVKDSKNLSYTERANELIHIRLYGDTYYGYTPFFSLLPDVVISSKIKELPLNWLKNNLFGSLIISFIGANPGKDKKKEIERKVKEQIGSNKAGQTLVLFNESKNDPDIKIDSFPRIDFNAADITRIAHLSEEEIVKRSGIPPEKISILRNSNRATITESDRILKEELVDPIQNLIEHIFNDGVIKKDMGISDCTFRFKDKDYRNKRDMAVASRTAVGLSINEIRKEIFGLEEVKDENADKILVPQGSKLLENINNPSEQNNVPFQNQFLKRDNNNTENISDFEKEFLKTLQNLNEKLNENTDE